MGDIPFLLPAVAVDQSVRRLKFPPFGIGLDIIVFYGIMGRAESCEKCGIGTA